MADKAPTGGGTSTRAPVVAAPADQDLPALIARLGDGILGLLDSKITLLKLDLDETVRGFGREAAAMALAAATVAIGIALGGCGLAFALVYLLPAGLDPLLARALAFVVVGSIAVGGGLVAFRRGSHVTEGRDG